MSSRYQSESSWRPSTRSNSATSARANYREPNAFQDSTAALDRGIEARVAEVAADVARAMDAYEIDRAVRPILPLIDDLSNWYLRRSRDRMREGAEAGDRAAALATMRWALPEISTIVAPNAPFIAELLPHSFGPEFLGK